MRLLNFKICLRIPTRRGRHHNLASLVNTQPMEELDPPIPPRAPKVNDDLSNLAARISSKLEDGNFRGAIRLACSEDSIAPNNEHTIAHLRIKHPDPHHDTNIPPPPTGDEVKGSLTVNEEAVHSSGSQKFILTFTPVIRLSFTLILFCIPLRAFNRVTLWVPCSSVPVC